MKHKNNGATVIVVGADHQNTLGILRACGMEGYRTYLIVHTSCEGNIRCAKSKYLNLLVGVVSENEEELISILLSVESASKIAVIPTSDFAAICIDKHYNKLNEKFFMPSISGEQGKIAKCMDKYYQYKMLSGAGYKVAQTALLKLEDNEKNDALDNFNFPLVLKPVVSAYGQKCDIVISKTKEAVLTSLEDLKERGYSEILVQEFVDKEYELVCFGSITPKTKSLYYGTLKKIRYYPYEGGASLSYAEYVDADKKVLPIINYLADSGYNGLFDIELFVVNDDIYINEINYRNSGNTWAIVKNGVNAPAAWVAETIGEEFFVSQKTIASGAFMNETSDLHYIFDRKINVFKWLRDLFRVKAFNKFWLKDLKGSLAWYRSSKKKN